MAKFPLKNRLWFNYVICIIFFVFSRYILQIITNYIFKDPQPSVEVLYLVNIIFYVLLFLCGCLAGYLINKRTILHSLLVTAIAIMFTIPLMGINLSNYTGLIYLLILGTVIGGVGGATALLVRKFCQSHQKK